eukprot:sb/3476489/
MTTQRHSIVLVPRTLATTRTKAKLPHLPFVTYILTIWGCWAYQGDLKYAILALNSNSYFCYSPSKSEKRGPEIAPKIWGFVEDTKVVHLGKIFVECPLSSPYGVVGHTKGTSNMQF